MPVQATAMGHDFTELLCLGCRLDYDRRDADRWNVMRLEGRRRLAHAGARRIAGDRYEALLRLYELEKRRNAKLETELWQLRTAALPGAPQDGRIW